MNTPISIHLLLHAYNFEKEGYELKPAQLKKLLNTKVWLTQHKLLEAAEKLIQHAPAETPLQLWSGFNTLFS